MTKQFYISVSIGNTVFEPVIAGTAKFEYYIRYHVLSTTLLSDSELELFIGTLAVLGLLEYYVPSSDYGNACVMYGDVSDNSDS